MDFSGQWQPIRNEDNSGNPLIGEYVGLPMNHAARLRVELYDPEMYALPEWQCRPQGAVYGPRGPAQLRIWREQDPDSRQLIAYHAEWLRTIDNPYFMDGRTRPSKNAPHTWGGFSTAEFVGDMLKITTTHLKEDYYRRNGVPASDETTIVQYWIRRGNIFTWVWISYDPIYLSEPLIRTSEYQMVPAMQIPPYPCEPVQELDRPADYVPHYLPGKNEFLNGFSKKFDIPLDIALGGAATMYPEVARKLTAERNGLMKNGSTTKTTAAK